MSSFPLDLSPSSSLERFKSLLRIRTITNEGGPTGAHRQAIHYLTDICVKASIAYEVLEYEPGWPIFVLTVPGTDPSLPSILLNSHYDVVPVFPDMWHYPAFDAVELPNGDIVARGAQDMKSVCSAYIEAILRLVASGAAKQFKRTLHAAFTPDEECGGYRGMGHWVKSEHFKKLNIGFALDEGLPNLSKEFITFYGERAVWWLGIRTEGPTGHGSRFIENTANEKLMKIIQRFLHFRSEQKALLDAAHSHGCSHSMMKRLELGDVVSVNLTMLKSGVTVDGGQTYSINVIPMVAEAGFDIRIPPTVDLVEFEERVKGWLEPGTTYKFFQKVTEHHVTSLDEEKNPIWGVFKRKLESLGYELKPEIFSAATDGRWAREQGIPCIGFSPIHFTPVLLHDHDERIHKDVYLKGIDIYEQLIPSLVNYENTQEKK